MWSGPSADVDLSATMNQELRSRGSSGHESGMTAGLSSEPEQGHVIGGFGGPQPTAGGGSRGYMGYPEGGFSSSFMGNSMPYMSPTGYPAAPLPAMTTPPRAGEGHPAGLFMDPSSVTNHMMMSFGMQYGQRMLRKTQDSFSRYFFSIEGLRYYFAVNNSYVKNKLKVLLFPLRHKFRRRECERVFEQHPGVMGPMGMLPGSVGPGAAPSQAQYTYLSAMEDINAPDMYIPVMSLITYVLLYGLSTALRGRPFSPELLLNTGSSCLMQLLLELLILRTGCYLLTMARPVYAMDLLCWAAYKYVGACVCLLLRPVLHPWLHCVLWVCLAAFHGFFMLKSLQYTCSSSSQVMQSYVMYLAAALQFPIYFWLLRG
eukprot:RCo025335